MIDSVSPKLAIEPAFDILRVGVLEGTPHGFFGSAGGAHQFGFGGPGEAQDVRLLRNAAADAVLGGAPLQAPHQVHSPEVVTIGKIWPDAAEGRPVADGVVTDRPEVVLGIVTADCAPVLFADSEAGVVGAAHAGWRGAVGNERGDVLENTLLAMEALGAERSRIAAAIGPTIAQASYEVDAAFKESFTSDHDTHFAPAPMREGIERWHFNLPGYIASKLEQLGVKIVADCGEDTLTQPRRFHSYRRSSQSGEPNYGRQISMIAAPG